MAEDREQDRTDERSGAARPVTAASRRERRASAHQSALQGRAGRPATKANRANVPVGRARANRADETAADEVAVSVGRAGTRTAKKTSPTPTRDRRRDKRPSLFAQLNRFVREVVGELRKVIWPTRKQQITYTVVVLVFVAVVVALVAGLDLLFAKGVFWIFA